MLFLKSLQLHNYCSYEDHSFNFLKPDGSPFQYICFFGPNGTGKSSLLEAITLLSMNTQNRPESIIKQSLLKFVRNKDYDPILSNFKNNAKNSMLIKGTYILDGNEYVVEITEDGFIRNDLVPISKSNNPGTKQKTMESGPWGKDFLTFQQRICYFLRADMDLSMNSFQLHSSQMENFEKIISEIMRYKTDCVNPSGLSREDREYCSDFIIHKKNHQIHFKRMSAGERKICKSFSIILNMMHDLSSPLNGEIPMEFWPRLLLIDNVEMHVYYDSHISMVNSLKEVFNKQQIFTTTHSGVLVQRYLNGESPEDELMIDLEKING